MSYTKRNWIDYPETRTPVNADNLNKMDNQIYLNAENIGDMDSSSVTGGSLVDKIDTLNTTIGTKSPLAGSSSLTTCAKGTLGNACTYGVTSNVTSGSTDLVTSGGVSSAIGNGTLTIQKNGSNVSTFTANSASNVTCNITVPTNNNQLTNGAGYITSSGSCASATKATQDGNGSTISSTYLKLSGGTLTGGLTLSSHSSAIGTRLQGYLASDKSIASGSAVNVASITLPPGSWIVVGQVSYAAAVSGKQYRAILTSTSSTTTSSAFTNISHASGTGAIWVQATGLYMPTANMVVYLNAYQNSGSAATASGGNTKTNMYAIRIS